MIGSQEPRLRIEPNRIESDGEDAVMLMEAYGFKPDVFQASVVDCWLGKGEDGEYNVTTAGLSMPRQNGKNGCLEIREFYGLILNAEKILHTAHQVRTAKKSFRRMVRFFTDKRNPEICNLVKKIRYTNGEESIELNNGGIIEYSARSRQAARGIDGVSLVVIDEAQELTDDQIESIMATLSASETGIRQILYTGTPPYPQCPGTVFRRRRVVCLNEPGEHDAWHEWSVAAESLDDINVEDKSLWYMTNPALGTRLTEEFTAEEMRTETEDGFARERLGWWQPRIEMLQEYALDKDKWEACKSKKKKPEGKTAYGIKFSADGSMVALCGAVKPKDGPSRISLIELRSTARGIGWLADWLNERYKIASCVVIDGRNGVDVLVERIADTWKAKGSIIRPRTKEMIAATSTLTNAINEEAVTWYYHQEALNDSAITSIKRPLGGGWGFGGDNSIPIEAASLALWGVTNSKRNPNREMRIG